MTIDQALNEEEPKAGDPPYYELRIALERVRNERDCYKDALKKITRCDMPLYHVDGTTSYSVAVGSIKIAEQALAEGRYDAD